MAARKAKLLLKALAEVTVIAPHVSPQTDAVLSTSKIKFVNKTFEAEDVKGFMLVVAATNNKETNRLVASSSKRHNIPVNVVDQPELGTFTIPSLVDRSPISIAVSTGGTSPVLARLLQAHLETVIPSTYGKLAEFVAQYR